MTPSTRYVSTFALLLTLLATACEKNTTRIVGPPQVASRPATMPTYVSPKGDFATKYPAAWQPHPCKDALLELVPRDRADSEACVVTVDVPWVPPHIFASMLTISRIDQGFIDALKKRMSNVVVDYDGAQTMPGAQARRIHARATSGGEPMVIDAVVALRGGNVYILSAEADQAGAPGAQATLESVLSNWKWQ